MRRFDFRWTAGVAGLAVVFTLASRWAFGPLGGQLALLRSGQLWRLLTGPLVHSNGGQLARDATAWLVLGAGWEASLGGRFPWLVVLSLAVPTGVVALFKPEWTAYYGLSGAVYALLTAAFVHEWRVTGGHPPRWMVGTGAASLLKLLYEALTGRLLIPLELGAGVAPAPLAHVAGVGVGLLLGYGAFARPPRLIAGAAPSR